MKVRNALLFITALTIGTTSQRPIIGAARAATHDPALIIDEDGCRYSPDITKVLLSLPQYSDMGMHTDKRAVRFSFESLHGVGVVENWDAEWSEDRLYFREELSALKAALGRIGLRVDAEGHVAVPQAAQDERALSVDANADNSDDFAGARSYLACGSV